MKLDTEARTATLADKQEFSYEHALIATGSNVRRLRVDGAALEGIHYLRALGNADAIRREAEDASDVVLVGGSFIACEVAASLTMLGKRCTQVMMEEAPMAGAFGAQAGSFFAGVLQSHGVRARLRGDAGGLRGGRARVSASSASRAPRSTPTWS